MNKIITTALFTYKEVIRGRVLLGSAMISLLIVFLNFLATELSYAEKVNISLDIGLGLTSLYGLGISLFIGSTLLSNEIENRTLFVVLSRPITRFQFFIGKYLGFSLVLFIIVTITSASSIIQFLIMGGKYQNLILWSYLGIVLESQIIFSLTIMFSLFCNKLLSVVYPLIVLLFAHNTTDILKLKIVGEANRFFINLFKVLLPNLSTINLKNYLLYDQSGVNISLNGFIYNFLYLLGVVFLSSYLFNNKDID